MMQFIFIENKTWKNYMSGMKEERIEWEALAVDLTVPLLVVVF